MSNIISSAEPSEALNKSVKNGISKHLFIVCNYNPESLIVYSDDAKFIIAVMNLYNFLIDAGICNNLSKFKNPYRLSADFRRFDQIIFEINTLRSFVGHNEDIRNGNEENKIFVERWFLDLIGKKYPESVDDYDKPLKQITQYGDEVISILKRFIFDVTNHSKKEEIVEKWIKLIFDYYKRPNNKKIFKDNLRLAYQAKIGPFRKAKDLDIAIWTEKMLFYNEESQNDSFESIIKGRKIPNDVLNKIYQKISDNKESMQRKRKDIAGFLSKQESSLVTFDYLDYYLSVFPQKLIDQFESGNIESLLPQDAIQKIIDNDFDTIPTI